MLACYLFSFAGIVFAPAAHSDMHLLTQGAAWAVQWFVECDGGWITYEPETNSFIEAAFQRGTSAILVSVHGWVYSVDLQGRFQQNRTTGTQRRMLRCLMEIPAPSADSDPLTLEA